MELNQSTGQNEKEAMVMKDYWLSLIAGLLIGLMFMPVLKMAKPDLYLKLRLAILPFFAIGSPLGLIFCHAISKKITFMWQFGKFFLTGIMNLLVDFGTLALVTVLFRKFLNIHSTDTLLTIGAVITFYSLFKALSFTVSNINSYFWNKYWTFDQAGDKKSEFFQFFIVSIVGFIVNVVVASLVFNGFSSSAVLTSDQWSLIGAAGGSVAGLFWNFFGYKFIVFKS